MKILAEILNLAKKMLTPSLRILQAPQSLRHNIMMNI